MPLSLTGELDILLIRIEQLWSMEKELEDRKSYLHKCKELAAQHIGKPSTKQKTTTCPTDHLMHGLIHCYHRSMNINNNIS